MSMICDPLNNKIYFSLDEKPTDSYFMPHITLRSGLSATFCRLFGTASAYTFLLEDGSTKSVTIDRKSLAAYVFCSYKTRNLKGKARIEKMQVLYKRINDKNGVHAKAYNYFITEISKDYPSLGRTCSNRLSDFARRINDFPFALEFSTYKGMCYKIKKENVTIGYLLGTTHAGTWEMAKLNPKITAAAFKSNKIAVEAIFSFFTKIRLSFLLNDEARKGLQQVFSFLESHGFSHDYSTEERLQYISKIAKTPLLGIENPRDQVNLLNNLFKKLGNFQLERHMNECLRAIRYIQEDRIEAIESLVDEMEKESERGGMTELFHEMLPSRNAVMTEYAENLLLNASQTSRIMVAVGAGHLVGAKGIIKGLENKGFTLIKM